MAIGIWLVRNRRTGEDVMGWLCGFDANADQGRGHVQATKDPWLAKRFETSIEAWELTKTRSTVRPGLVPMDEFELEVKAIPPIGAR